MVVIDCMVRCNNETLGRTRGEQPAAATFVPVGIQGCDSLFLCQVKAFHDPCKAGRSDVELEEQKKKKLLKELDAVIKRASSNRSKVMECCFVASSNCVVLKRALCPIPQFNQKYTKLLHKYARLSIDIARSPKQPRLKTVHWDKVSACNVLSASG